MGRSLVLDASLLWRCHPGALTEFASRLALSGLWTTSTLTAPLPIQSTGAFAPPRYGHGVGVADIKVGRKGRAEARTDFTGPGLGQGLAAG